jgi:hypothetical protein
VSPMADAREWMLVAPWYRWRRQGVPGTLTPRQTRPVFQKYDTADLVNAFLADPQRSFRFLPEEDEVGRLEPAPSLPPLPANLQAFFGKRKRRLTDLRLRPTGIRKLYLDTHKRFYLVVCELHCDAPGFPSVNRDEVCEAGFVVRRRRVECPPGSERQAARILRGVASASAELTELDRLAVEHGLAGNGRAARSPGPAVEAGREALGRARAAAAARLGREREALRAWAAETGAGLTVDGWVPSQLDRVGQWQAVEDEPQALTEAVYPLYPLVPDPAVTDHAGQGVTIYFGLVPTSGAEAGPDGTARFDDRSPYEMRCFVRRHRPECPRTPGRDDCNGRLVWSRASECYQLAAHFDLRGTANRPVTIQQPDVPALQAQAADLKVGQGAPLTLVSPPGSSIVVNSPKKFPSDANDVVLGGNQTEICSFPIPLITIVATFVFSIFMPIVVFLLGLWFLLRLKFCIPPSAQVSANLATELELLPAAAADRAVDLDLAVGLSVHQDLQTKLKTNLEQELGADIGDALVATSTNNLLVRLHQDMAGADLQAGPAAGQVLEEPERRSEVLRS